MPTPTGQYAQRDGTPTVRFERTFSRPVAEVWAAITDPDRLARWFPTSVEFSSLRPGSPIEFRFVDDAYPPLAGEFREVSAPQALSFTWGEDLLTFRLTEADEGEVCRLRFAVALDAAGKAARDAAGWDVCLDGLATTLAGGLERRPVAEGAWADYYAQYQAAGLLPRQRSRPRRHPDLTLPPGQPGRYHL
jgi:uncharacterized protein YndB with AHSA1/START domain